MSKAAATYMVATVVAALQGKATPSRTIRNLTSSIVDAYNIQHSNGRAASLAMTADQVKQLESFTSLCPGETAIINQLTAAFTNINVDEAPAADNEPSISGKGKETVKLSASLYSAAYFAMMRSTKHKHKLHEGDKSTSGRPPRQHLCRKLQRQISCRQTRN